MYYTYIYVYVYTHVYTYVCTYIYIYIHTYGFTWMCMCYDRKFDDIPIFGDGHQSIDKD